MPWLIRWATAILWVLICPIILPGPAWGGGNDPDEEHVLDTQPTETELRRYIKELKSPWRIFAPGEGADKLLNALNGLFGLRRKGEADPDPNNQSLWRPLGGEVFVPTPEQLHAWLNPPKPPPTQERHYFVNPPSDERGYEGVELTIIRKRFSKGQALGLSYVFDPRKGLVGQEFGSGPGPSQKTGSAPGGGESGAMKDRQPKVGGWSEVRFPDSNQQFDPTPPWMIIDPLWISRRIDPDQARRAYLDSQQFHLATDLYSNGGLWGLDPRQQDEVLQLLNLGLGPGETRVSLLEIADLYLNTLTAQQFDSFQDRLNKEFIREMSHLGLPGQRLDPKTKE